MDGRIALITGATGGLGPAVVRALADDGALIVATGHNPAKLAALQGEIGLHDARWLGQAADLADPASAQGLVDAAVARFGSVDILVSVAGGWRGGKRVADSDLDTLQWLLDINLVTAFNACRAVLPSMIERGWGRIVTIGARGAVWGQARSGAYSASKAALLALTQSIAAETLRQGVTANTVLVSTIDTPANRSAMPDADYTRWVTPEQIAATVRFLCTDDAASVSGAAIPVYGQA